MGTVNKQSSATVTPTLTTSFKLTTPAEIVLFEGILDGWSISENKLNISVTNILSRWAQRTLSTHSSSCRWKKFKGTECGYTGGEAWCDRTHARCQALGNEAHYGGFPWLPSIVGKEIWWGRIPENE